MAEASRMGGRFAPYISAWLSIWLLVFVSKQAECLPALQEDSDLRALFDSLRATVPASSMWVGVARLPARATLELLSLSSRLLQDDMEQSEVAAPIDLAKRHLSYFAFDVRGQALGYLMGHVTEGKAHLDFLHVGAGADPKAVERKLMMAWATELQREGVSEAFAVTPVLNVTALNQMLRLGFRPSEVITRGEEVSSATPRASRGVTRRPSEFDEGSSGSAVESASGALAPADATKGLPEDSQSSRPSGRGPPEGYPAPSKRPTEALKDSKGSTTPTHVRWHLPLPYDNGRSTYALERTGELRDLLIPEARAALHAKGIIPKADDVEVVLTTEADESLLMKTDAFAKRLPGHESHLPLTDLDGFALGFIAKTKGPDPQVVGFATSRISLEGLMVVPRLYVADNCEGYASLLLGKAIRNKAYEIGVDAALVFVPQSAIKSWHAFAESGFALEKVGDDGIGLMSEFTYPSRDSYPDFLGQQRLEYQLATYQAQLAGKAQEVIPLSLPKDFERRYKAQTTSHVPSPPPTLAHMATSISSTPHASEMKEKVPEKREGELQRWALVAVLFIGVGLAALLAQRAEQRRRFKGRAASGFLRSDPSRAGGIRWEWQPAPASNEDEKSIELDEFAVSTRDSLSITRPGASSHS